MHLILRSCLVVSLSLLTGVAGAATASGGTKPDLLSSSKSETGTQTLANAPFNTLLDKFLRDGRIDYAALKADSAATAQLQAYVEAIAAMPDSEPLSSWINAYNALVVHAVLTRYPLKSVQDAAGGDFRFFREILYTVAGKARSLDDIENGVICPRFQDARIHVALNCGALSCPPLAPHAFEEVTLDSTLDHLAEVMVNDGHHVYMMEGKLVVNEIFKWFEQDFVRDRGSLLKWIQNYSADAAIKALAADVVIEVYPYNWALAAH